MTIDYVRNIATHYLLSTDINHAGDVRYFDKNAALSAVSATNSEFGCGTGTNAAWINCALHSSFVSPITGAPGATMSDYAANGLDSPTDLGVGQCNKALGISCAFREKIPAQAPSRFSNLSDDPFTTDYRRNL